MTGDPQVFPLAVPVEHKGTTHTELAVRRPKVKDLIAAERQPGEIAREAALLAICAGVPFTMVGEMDVADYRSIVVRTGIDFLAVGGGAELSAETSSSSTPGPTGASKSS